MTIKTDYTYTVFDRAAQQHLAEDVPAESFEDAKAKAESLLQIGGARAEATVVVTTYGITDGGRIDTSAPYDQIFYTKDGANAEWIKEED